MKKLIGYLLTAIAAYAGGVATGYILRKKTSEVVFEEITEEEQAAQIAEDEKKEPFDVKRAIDEVFDSTNENPAQQDTQKEELLNKWKAEAAMVRYDTRSNEEPENAVVADDELENGFDHDFLNEAEQDAKEGVKKPAVEPASMEDWEHWESLQGQNFDAEYDCLEVLWFQDGVLTHEDGDPIDNPGKYLGFDVEKQFNEIDEDTTGDPDIRIVYNHRKGAIFQIIRQHCDYNRKTGMEEFGSDYGREDEDDE